MDWLVLSIVLAGLGTIAAARVRAARRRAQLQEHDRRLALTGIGLSLDGPSASGQLSGFEVRYERQADQHRWAVVLPTSALSLHPKPVRRFRERYVSTGDRAFDDRYALQGGPKDLSWLSPAVRSLLIDALAYRPEIEAGTLVLCSDRFDMSALDSALQIAARISEQSRDDSVRIAKMLSDPNPSVRIASLRSLASLQSRGAEHLSAVMSDSDPEVRAAAAILLRDAGQLEQVLASSDLAPETRRDAASWLRSLGDKDQRLRAGIMLAREGPLLQIAAIDLLRSAGREGEEALIEIARSASPEVFGQLLTAIEEVGSVRAVAALRKRQRELSSLLNEERRRLIERVIKGLKRRSGGVSGSLSIASAESGALSVLPEQGSVSKAQEST